MKMKHRILVVEDELPLWHQIEHLVHEKYPECEVQHAANEMEAQDLFRGAAFSVVITDVDLTEEGGNEEGGFDVLEMAKRCEPDTEVIVISSIPKGDRHSRTRERKGLSFIFRHRDSGYLDMLEKEICDALRRFEYAQNRRTDNPIRLLHLSDLHFNTHTAVKARLQPLVDDIKRCGSENVDRLDYLCVSGDFTDRGCVKGLEKAYEFLSGLIKEFALSEEHCILVPGNHDVVDLPEAFEELIRVDGKNVTVRSVKYPLRFKPFSEKVYRKFFQHSYPFEYAAQGMAIPFWDTGLQFLALNSCWEIDRYDWKRAGLHEEAVANALREAQKQENDARASGELPPEKPLLRIAVWHHAADGAHQIRDARQLLGNLQGSEVRICLHGDVHELWRSQHEPWNRGATLYIVGAGSFGAPSSDRPEATPCL